MAELIEIKSFKDSRGSLSVLEDNISFEIKRVFYIYDVDDSIRGNHRHHKTIQAAICINCSCVISNNKNKKKEEFILDHPSKCLMLYPEDFHSMHSFSKGAILLVLASEKFDPLDYIYEEY